MVALHEERRVERLGGASVWALTVWVTRCPRRRKYRVGNEMMGSDLNLR